MKLLFDQNLSPRLASQLSEHFPGSAHIRDLDMASASDTVVWEYAAENGFAILSKDADFHQRSLLLGHPPKVVWVRLGNCTTDQVRELLISRVSEIRSFLDDAEAAFLALG